MHLASYICSQHLPKDRSIDTQLYVHRSPAYMAKFSSLLLLFLAIAAASMDAPPAAVAMPNAAVIASLENLSKWKKRAEKVEDFVDIVGTAIDAAGGDGENTVTGLLKAAEAVSVLEAGGMNFSVTGVDVTSPVTRTSRCGAGADSRMVPCRDPLCKQYGAKCGGGGGGGAAQFCNSSSSSVLPLQKGNVALFSDRGRLIYGDNTAYVCRPAGSGDNAVVGLSRDSLLLSELRFRLFSYILDSDLRSTVWLSTQARLVAALTGSKTTVRLGMLPDKPYYAVGVTGIKFGDDGNVKENNSIGVLTTTMPFTFLNPVLFDHLKQELSSVSPPVHGPLFEFDQLCYSKKTTLPVISLFFSAGDDNRVMKVNPEQYSYQSKEMRCLTILRSPLEMGVSVIGSMLQVGRQMTYNLDDHTLTFGDAMSLRRSFWKQAQSSSARTHVSRLAFAWVPLLLAMII